MFQPRVFLNSVVFFLITFLAASSTSTNSSTHQCRCYPGETCWPSPAEWAALNTSVDGRLVATIPLGSPCHDPNYDASVCKTLQENWIWPQEHYMSSSSVMAPFFANQSCDPYTPESQPCTLGNYVDYAINVSSPSDIAKGIAFAAENNIRLVIRNTGHDYIGKSTGAFALAIWTHHLKSISFTDYQAPSYTGTGQFLRATPDNEHADLYWALSGGGGGTYGVVWSLTAKAHPDIAPVSGANLTFSVSSDAGVSADTFFAAVTAWHENLPRIVDAGAMTVYYISNTTFTLTPFTGPGISASEATELLRPFLDTLDRLEIEYDMTGPTEFSSYLDEYHAFQLPIEVGTAQYGGRLIPRSVVEKDNDALTAAIRTIVERDSSPLFIGIGLNVNRSVVGDEVVERNAVLPAWRETLVHTVLATPWNFTAPLSEMLKLQDEMTDVLVPQLSAITPGSGCYLNEGDPNQPNWQDVFYGANYARLRSIKNKYDPHDVFYARTAVGSEEWEVQGPGVLCRTRKET